MSLPFTELNIEIQHKRLLAFRTRLGFDRLADLFQFDEVPFRIFFCKPTGTDADPFEVQDWEGDAFSMGVNTTALTGSSVETSLALQTTWDWNTTLDCAEGLLDLSAAGVGTYLATSPSKDALLEVKVIHAAGGTQRYLQEKFTLKAAAIEVAATTPAAGDRYLLAGEADQLYAKRVGQPGEWQSWTNQEGTYRVRRSVDENGNPQDQTEQLA